MSKSQLVGGTFLLLALLLSACAGEAAIAEPPAADRLEEAQTAIPYGGVFSYQTTNDFEVAIGFYRGRMLAEGWMLIEEITTENTCTMTFTKGDRARRVVISPLTDDPDLLSVLIIEE